MNISVTGFQKLHIGGTDGLDTTNSRGMTFMHYGLISELNKMGHHAKYQGQDNMDLLVVMLVDFSQVSLRPELFDLTTKLIKEAQGKVIFGIEDWNLDGIYKSIKRRIEVYKEDPDNAFGTHMLMKGYRMDPILVEYLEKAITGKSYTIYPGFKIGNKKLLGIPGESDWFDYTSLINFTPTPGTEKSSKRIPIEYSMADNSAWLKKQGYIPKVDRKDISHDDWNMLMLRRKPEQTCFDMAYSFGIMIMPQYKLNKAGVGATNQTGWWRNRYAQGRDGRILLVDSIDDCFGDNYRIKHGENPFDIRGLEAVQYTDSEFEELVEAQNQCLNDGLSTEEEFQSQVLHILKRANHLKI